MCYDGKCCHCIEVETGSFIYAIINVIFTALGTVSSIVAMFYFNVVVQEVVHNEEDQGNKLKLGMFVIGVDTVLSILIVFLSISFAFAVVLIVGICKRNHRYVKAYFIFDVMRTVLGLIMFPSMLKALAVVVFVIIYYMFVALILVMIRKTYLKFQMESNYTNFTNPLTVVAKY